MTRRKPRVAERERLPETRKAVTHKFEIGGHEGYISTGEYPDGRLGEIFIVISKQGSTMSGLLDTLATTVSLALQYGVPLKVLVAKFSFMRYEPSGWTVNEDIRQAFSITDYIFRWLGKRYLSASDFAEVTNSEEESKSHMWMADRPFGD